MAFAESSEYHFAFLRPELIVHGCFLVEIGLFVAFFLAGVGLCRYVYSRMDSNWEKGVRRGVLGLIVAVGAVALNASICLYYLIARPPLNSTILGRDFNAITAILMIVSAILAGVSLVYIFRGVQATVQKSRDVSRMLEAFVQNTPAAVSLKDIDRYYTLVNNTFRDWFSKDAELLNRRAEDIAPPDQTGPATEIENTVLETGQPVVREVLAPAGNNRTRTLLMHKFPLKDEDGNIIGIGGIETDISRQKRVETQLEQTLDRLNEAMRITKLGFWEWDEVNDESISLAPNFLEMMGVPVDGDEKLTFTAEEMFRFIHPEDVESYKIASNVRLSMHDRFVAAYRVKLPNDEIRHLQEIGQAVRSKDGTLIRSFGTIQDITEPVELAESLRRAREEAVAADRAKTEFLAHMSHELRSPLNSILGFSQIIEGNVGNMEDWSSHAEYAGYIRESGQHLLGIIDDILDLAKIEHGSFDIRFSSVEIEKSIRDCIKIVESSRPTKTAEFTVSVEPSASHLIADQRLIRQILINIYSNAAKFTPDTGKIDTKVTLAAGEDKILVEIADTGCGIDPKDIPLVLSPFGQARTNINVAHGGVGLGLALTKRMTELHGGTLSLQSSIGVGTTISLLFPIGQQKDAMEMKSA